jgi:cyanophycin synthetase
VRDRNRTHWKHAKIGAAPMSHSGFCRFDPNWSALTGTAYGLRQPAIVGGACVGLPGSFDFRPLDEAMAAHVDEPLPPLPKAASAGHRLLFRALHWTGALQRQHRIPVSDRFHVAAAGPHPGGGERFLLAVPYVEQAAASAALNWVRHAVLGWLEDGRLAPDEEQLHRRSETLSRRLAAAAEPGINTFRFIRAADREGIPVTQVARGLFAFGLGRPSRWLYSSMLDSTSAIATMIARDKYTCAAILREAGLPGASNILAAGEEAALEAARSLGYPVVVKPRDLDQGAGVAAGLEDEGEVRKAFAAARAVSGSVMVEKHFEGSDFRMVVLDGAVIQVFGRHPGGVTGDGGHSIAELLALRLESEDMRQRERMFGKRLLTLDEEALDLLRARGLEPGSVVSEGAFVALRRKANVSTGGLPFPVPIGEVHPDNALLAVHAAAALRLDFAGVDLIIADIGASWLETGALICEVNAMPQLSQRGEPQVYAQVLRTMLGARHSVPVWLHLSAETPPVPEDLIARTGVTIGYASAHGVRVGAATWAGPQAGGFAAARALLRQQAFDAAILHLTPADILRSGVPAMRIQRAIIEADCLDEAEALARLLPHVDEVVATRPIDGLPDGVAMTIRQSPADALGELGSSASAP